MGQKEEIERLIGKIYADLRTRDWLSFDRSISELSLYDWGMIRDVISEKERVASPLAKLNLWHIYDEVVRTTFGSLGPHPLTEVEIARIAQNMTDEGTFNYVRPPRPVYDVERRLYWSFHPRVTVRMKNRETIQYFASLLGARWKRVPAIPDVYEYIFSGRRLVSFLGKARTYITGAKAPHADLMLKHKVFYVPYVTPPPPAYLSLRTPQRLIEVARRAVQITPAPVGRPPFPPEIPQTVKRLHSEGWTDEQIAKELGVSRSYIYETLTAEEVHSRRGEVECAKCGGTMSLQRVRTPEHWWTWAWRCTRCGYTILSSQS